MTSENNNIIPGLGILKLGRHPYPGLAALLMKEKVAFPWAKPALHGLSKLVKPVWNKLKPDIFPRHWSPWTKSLANTGLLTATIPAGIIGAAILKDYALDRMPAGVKGTYNEKPTYISGLDEDEQIRNSQQKAINLLYASIDKTNKNNKSYPKVNLVSTQDYEGYYNPLQDTINIGADKLQDKDLWWLFHEGAHRKAYEQNKYNPLHYLRYRGPGLFLPQNKLNNEYLTKDQHLALNAAIPAEFSDYKMSDEDVLFGWRENLKGTLINQSSNPTKQQSIWDKFIKQHPDAVK